jgi:hypothetical protein
MCPGKSRACRECMNHLMWHPRRWIFATLPQKKNVKHFQVSPCYHEGQLEEIMRWTPRHTVTIVFLGNSTRIKWGCGPSDLLVGATDPSDFRVWGALPRTLVKWTELPKCMHRVIPQILDSKARFGTRNRPQPEIAQVNLILAMSEWPSAWRIWEKRVRTGVIVRMMLSCWWLTTD